MHKALGAKAFDRLEVVLAQGEQGQVALEDVAVGDASTHRVLGINHGGQVDALEQAPNQCQTSVAAQIVGQLFDDKFNRFGHECFLHLQGERQMWVKCLICIRIYPERVGEVTDSGSERSRLLSSAAGQRAWAGGQKARPDPFDF